MVHLKNKLQFFKTNIPEKKQAEANDGAYILNALKWKEGFTLRLEYF